MLRVFVPAVLLLSIMFTATAQAAPDASVKSDAKVAAAAPASAPAEPSVDDIIEEGKKAVGFFQSGQVRAGIAAVIAVLIGLWRKFGSKFLIGKIPTKALPWVTAGIAVLAALPVALVADPWSWKTFIWQGFITGAGAMAIWSMVIKFAFGKLPQK